jgi:hypothetical protein
VASDALGDLRGEIRDLLERGPDEYLERWLDVGDSVAGFPAAFGDRFRALADERPAEVFQLALAILEARFQTLIRLQRYEYPTEPRYIWELERWNIAGLAFLRPDYAGLAETMYARMLLLIREAQEASDSRLHKGTPYHMLGYAELLRNETVEAHEYFILAAFEDALISENWQEGPAARMLSAQWNADAEFDQVAELARLAAKTGERARILVWNPELLLMEKRVA